MASGTELRKAWSEYYCAPAKLVAVDIAGRKLSVAPGSESAWLALSAVLSHHGYSVRKSDTGSYNCRSVRGGEAPSLHSYGIAVDFNWSTNPQIKTPDKRKIRWSLKATQDERAADVRAGLADTDMTEAMIADVLAIKTSSGRRVFTWGGYWLNQKDAMHVELAVGPDVLATGIDRSSVAGLEPANGKATGARHLRAYEIAAPSGLRLRAGPGQDFDILGLLPDGGIVYELGRDGAWSVVDREGDGLADGSVSNRYLQRRADLDRLPAARSSGGEEANTAAFRHVALEYHATDLHEEPGLDVVLDVQHRPQKDWAISKDEKTRRFVVTAKDLPQPLVIGRLKSFHYARRGLTTSGLGRTSYEGLPGSILFDPGEWNEKFDLWPELIYPTAYAESGADFCVVNAWDLAGLTVGFIQLAAHTSDDLIPLLKRLITEVPDEAETYFPELTLVRGELCYRKGTSFRYLERRVPPADPVPNDLVDRGLVVSFFNRDRKALGPEELHAAARWLAWTHKSERMREIQIAMSIENMRDAVNRVHAGLLSQVRDRYPDGVDGMRCDHLAAAIAVPHLAPQKVSIAVWALCQPDILKAFETIEYGPGDRENNVVAGVRRRGERLSRLRFDYRQGRPV